MRGRRRLDPGGCAYLPAKYVCTVRNLCKLCTRKSVPRPPAESERSAKEGPRTERWLKDNPLTKLQGHNRLDWTKGSGKESEERAKIRGVGCSEARSEELICKKSD